MQIQVRVLNIKKRISTEKVQILVQEVPNAPSRPMITSFTSRSVNLSWVHTHDPTKNSVLNFIIENRYNQIF
jgi:hypothetical protein